VSGAEQRGARVRPGTPARLVLREALEEEGRASAFAFAEAVVAQAAVPLGSPEPPVGRDAAEERTARLVLALLLEPDAANHAATLRAEPALLAAMFGNIDLLFGHGDPGAAAISALVLDAAHGG
jgi:hypothetical protein